MIMVEVKNGSASRATARGYGDLVWGGEKDEDIHLFREKDEDIHLFK
jgi:hypothetical protein